MVIIGIWSLNPLGRGHLGSLAALLTNRKQDLFIGKAKPADPHSNQAKLDIFILNMDFVRATNFVMWMGLNWYVGRHLFKGYGWLPTHKPIFGVEPAALELGIG